MKIKDAIVDYFSKGTLVSNMVLGLCLITPIFLVAAFPAIVLYGFIPSGIRYEERFYWLQDMSWIWPCVIVGIGFLSALGYMIYNNLRDTGKIK